MAEYQLIAKLSGPEGPRPLSNPILLTETDDLDDLDPEVYRVGSTAVAEALGTPGHRLGTIEVLQSTARARVQRFTTNYGGSSTPLEILYRGTNLDGEYQVDWEQAWPQEDTNDPILVGNGAHEGYLEEAEVGKYIPTNYTAVEVLGLPVRGFGVITKERTSFNGYMLTFEADHASDYQIWKKPSNYSGEWVREWELVSPRPGAGGGSFLDSTHAYASTISGDTTLANGKADTIPDSDIASITKLMTVWTAVKYMEGEGDWLDEQVTITDLRPTQLLQIDDVVTVRDLIYAAMVPSNNTGPAELGMHIGDIMLADEGETGRGLTRFTEQMADDLQELGYEGASTPGTVGSGRMTPRQIADLTRRFREDSFLWDTISTLNYTINITGPNARTENVNHTVINDGAPEFPQFLGGKTGSFDGKYHLTAVWQHPDGSEHIGVILNSDSTLERMEEFNKIISITR